MNQVNVLFSIGTFAYIGASFLVLVVDFIFCIRAYTYISRKRGIYKTNALIGDVEDKGNIFYDFLNIIRASKLVIIVNVLYKIIGFVENDSLLLKLSLISMVFSLFVIADEYKSN